ncbi:MAG: class I SAM-dependent methyltransferase [Steroidobacteraceae bacterium]
MDTARQRNALSPHLEVQRIAFGPLFFQAARAARDMGVLGALDEAGRPGLLPAEVAARAGISLYAARVLLEACLSLNLVSADGWRFRIGRAGRLLLHDASTRINMDFVHNVCYLGAYRLEDSLREGRPVGLEAFGEWPTLYEALPHLPEPARTSWLDFDHFYSDRAFPLALDVILARRPRRILDVGGNTGKFAIACLQRAPDASVTIVDLPGQLAIARDRAADAGVGDRVDGIAMDLLDHRMPLPSGYDAVWMSQFLDCFPEPDIVELVRRGADALAPGGRLYINETCWDRQPNEVGRLCLHATSLYFTIIANGTSRMYHSEDLLRCIAAAGLEVEADLPLGAVHTLFVCRAPE